jgi:hypothetical protein
MKTVTETPVLNFASAVRAELADLSKRELEELTEGLAADLEERFAEEGEAFNPGSAAAYAAELREAAGVAPKSTKRKVFSSAALIENTQSWFRRSSFGSQVLEFGISIRPAWWVFRAVLAWLVTSWLGVNLTETWALLPIFVFLSIQWGRKKWFTNRFFTSILLPLNLLAIVLVIPAQEMVIRAANEFNTMSTTLNEVWSNQYGLVLNGQPVDQVRAFDANGVEVTGLTFEDQTGTPLFPGGTEQGALIQVPNFTGMSLQELNKEVVNLGISGVEFNRVDDATDEEAVVIATVPAAGEFISANDALLVIIGRTN